MLKKLLLALPLALALALPGRTGPGGSPGIGPGSGPGTGPVAGKWDVPTPFTGGALLGRARSQSGVDIFGLRATVARVPGQAGGTIKGVAIVERGPRAGQKLALVGHWQADSRGNGTFRAKIVDRSASGALRVRARLGGAFRDDVPMQSGNFRGAWSLPR